MPWIDLSPTESNNMVRIMIASATKLVMRLKAAPPFTESDTPLLRESCPHTRWSGLQIRCKREGPHEVRRAERIQRESSSLHARSSPGRGVAAGYTGAKRAS